ncbi:MAG: UDP-N-acetylmuramoyl-L-alanine--D-glutamate ligase [Hyphomicrobiales bacterium]|nr:UDP-N-acetylmuramoyl-L-alanine--D-glutamate ligase [Hyphomicrobiales bacterium]
MASSERAAIWGFGREGRAAFQHLKATRPDLDLVILNDTPVQDAPDGVRILTGDDAMRALASGEFALVVKSPGVSLYRPEVAAAKACGTLFTSGTNLWFEQYPNARTIVVTGTKGKSTTSRLIHHLLVTQGLDAKLLGNVGVAALEEAPGRDWTVFELSSYQLADFAHAGDIALVTNLYPEHAPWHGGVETYYRDKLNALRDQKKTVAVVNRGQNELAARVTGRANLRWYNDDAGFHEREGRLYFGAREIEVVNFALPGAHNVSNLAAACTIAEMAGVTGLRERVDMTGFQQLRHRLEEFSAGTLTCVDDSISTVPQATLAALAAYAGRSIVLLAGGSDRGQDYAELAAALLKAPVHALILLPVTGARLREALQGRAGFEIVDAPGLDVAVEEAIKRAPKDGVVLLSPAAPSFEEFRNFEERGARFKELCARFAKN